MEEELRKVDEAIPADEASAMWEKIRRAVDEFRKAEEELKKMVAPQVVLAAAEKAHLKGIEKAATLNSRSEMEFGETARELALGHYHMTACSEFARQLGAQLIREDAIRRVQVVSRLPQAVVRNLWREVAASVTISRGLRGHGGLKGSLMTEKKSVRDKSQFKLRVNRRLGAELLARLGIHRLKYKASRPYA